MAAPLYTTDSGLLWHAGKILIVAVGLPARGKTHISRALERYLRWMGVKTQVISLGDHRRKVAGGAQRLPADYFTIGERSAETTALRARVLESCEQLIWDYFDDGGQVVIYDANNGTRDARNTLATKFDAKGIHVIMLGACAAPRDLPVPRRLTRRGRVAVRRQGDHRAQHPQRQDLLPGREPRRPARARSG
jgi:6-phosphofructo-2-kinase/fructose-2,6-biphosphatase 4